MISFGYYTSSVEDGLYKIIMSENPTTVINNEISDNRVGRYIYVINEMDSDDDDSDVEVLDETTIEKFRTFCMNKYHEVRPIYEHLKSYCTTSDGMQNFLQQNPDLYCLFGRYVGKRMLPKKIIGACLSIKYDHVRQLFNKVEPNTNATDKSKHQFTLPPIIQLKKLSVIDI